MAKITTIQELYTDQLQDLYSAEKQIIEALPKMAEAAENPQLKQGFELHLAQTKEQAKRLEQIFKKLDADPNGEFCQGTEGLLKEGKKTMKEVAPGPVLDAGLIADAQRVEHYEIAGYGTAITLAKQVGDTEAAALLAQTLAEEKQTDEKLTQIAESQVNAQAAKKN